MNINLHNYESWFHLYVDGELSPAQMSEVEAFTQKHPHLEAELEHLMNTILAVPTISMPGKHRLLKAEEWDADKLEPWQEKMLLQLDGEMDGQAAMNDMQQAEWQRLLSTRLIAEPLVMAKKDKLMSHSMHRPTVISMAWVRRVAVAAAVSGLMWAFWPQTNSTKSSNVADAVVKNESARTNPQTGSNSNLSTPDKADLITTENSTQKTQNEEAAMAVAVNNKTDEDKTAVSNRVAAKAPVDYSNVAQLAVVRKAPDEKPETIETIKRPTIAIDEIEEAAVPLINTVATNQSTAPEFVIEEQYLGSDGDGEEVVNIGGIKLRKSKIRGVLRSVSRNVTRRTSGENIQEALFTR